METTRVRLGIIGLGVMGGEMLKVACRHPDFDVVLAADPDTLALERTRAAHPEVTCTRDATQLVGHDGLDALYIASPPATHAGYTVPAMKAGKAVFAEKPLAVDLTEGEEMVQVAAATGVANAVNFALSDRSATLAIIQAVRDGAMGSLRGVEMKLTFPEWPRAFQRTAGWVAGRAQGGFVREVASHFFFLTDRVLGPLVPVHARLGHGEQAEESAVGLFLAGDVPVTLQGQVAAGPETYEWTLYGSARSYRMTGWGDLWVGDGTGWSAVDLPGPRGSEHARLSEFARAIRGGSSTLADFATGLRVQRLVELFHRADR